MGIFEKRSGSLLGYPGMEASGERMPTYGSENREMLEMQHSLSVVLPAYNEEQAIARTVSDVLGVLHNWMKEFEVIVVNDGSTDSTASIVAVIAESDPRVRLISHTTNQGYGAA